MEGRAETLARNPAHRVELCFLRLWFYNVWPGRPGTGAGPHHWLARKIDFLVRVSRRVPKVPRFDHCRSTVRQPRLSVYVAGTYGGKGGVIW